MQATKPRILTARLDLTRINKEHERALSAILSDPEVMYAWEHGFSAADCREWFDRQYARYAQGQEGLFAVTLRSTGQVIGWCGITLQDISGMTPCGDICGSAAETSVSRENSVWEIGYGFAKQFWHNGYALEAAKACKLLAFSLNISEVYSIIRTNNLPSIRVAERNGMSPVGTVVKHYRGKVMPHTVFKTSI